MGVAIVVGGDIEPGAKVVALLAIYPVSLVTIVMHEATHAFVARLVGWQVRTLEIGLGEPWFRFRLGGTNVVVHHRPSGGGRCTVACRVGAVSRRGITLFVGAPMVMHAVAAAVALRWASGGSLGGVVAAMFVASNLFLIPLNAWPRDLPHRSAATANDGKRLLDLWRSPDRELLKWRFSAGLLALRLDQKPDEGFKEAERALALEPGSDAAAACLVCAAQVTGRREHMLPHVAAYARAIEASYPNALRKLSDGDLAARGVFRGKELEEYMRGSLFVGLDRLEETLALSERGVEAATCEETRALWQGCVALALLMIGRDLERAEEAARYAYERLPWVPFVETAWGMARIERGDTRVGLAAFMRVARIDSEGSTAWLRTAWTAAARAAEGRPDRAISPDLQSPSVWPVCRRRAERALAQ